MFQPPKGSYTLFQVLLDLAQLLSVWLLCCHTWTATDLVTNITGMYLSRLTRESSSVTAKLSLRAICHHHMLTASSTHKCCGSDMKAKKIFSGCVIGMTLATNSFADIANKSADLHQSPSRLYLAQAQLDTSEAESRLKAEHDATAKAVEAAKVLAAEDAKAKMAAAIQLKAIENANNLKYAGGLSEALQNNKDKGLDWFKNKLFKLDKASVITMCDPGICYVVAFSGLSGLGITSENGDFNGRQLQGQLVRVIGTDRFGNIVVTRLTTNDKPSQNSLPAKHLEEVRQIPLDKPERQQAPADDVGDEVAGSFDDLIRARASEGWARPPSAKKGMKVVLQIGMLPDGTMKSVSVARSSGDTPFDNSAVAAVKNVGRLPEMQGLRPSDFQPYRSFTMVFTTEDLTL